MIKRLNLSFIFFFLIPMAINTDHIEPPKSTNTTTVQAAATRGGGGGGGSWWSVLNWIADSLMFGSCKPMNIFPLLLPNWSCTSLMRSPPLRTSTVIGTILIVGGGGGGGQKKKNVKLTFQYQDTPTMPFLILDLPINANYCDLGSGPCRIALECDRARSGGGSLLGVDTWRVYVNGRKVGFGWRRESTFDVYDGDNIGWALEMLRVVSIGVGILTPPSTGGGGRMEYLRGRFERVVGSADSQSYHLVDPAGCLQGHELSFFFVRL